MKQLDKITAMVKYLLEVNQGKITGFVDTSAKFLACYLAVKLTDVSILKIADYYSINAAFMEKKCEEMAVQMLVDEGFKKEVNRISVFYKDLELITNNK